MGLPNWINWMTWFFDAFFATFITVGIVVVLICVEWSVGYGKIIMDSNWFMMYIFFMLYGVSLIWFKFALSTFFTSRKLIRKNTFSFTFLKTPCHRQIYAKIFIISANLALTTGIVVHLITYFLPNVTVSSKGYITMSVAKKVLLSLLPNGCML